MCGIVGVVGKDAINQRLYDALTVLQHRGQDAAGIVTCHGHKLALRKGNGMVRDVFQQRHMDRLTGDMGLGHVRYPTAGTCSSNESQPFYVNSPYGITLAHNGNLTNADQLTNDLFQTDLRHINTSSDSEVLLNVFAHELQTLGRLEPAPDDIFAAVSKVHQRVRGAYAVVAMIAGHGIVAFRDPHGIRPLIFGQRESGYFTPDYMIASESVALDTAGFTVTRDVQPGEAVYISLDGKVHTRQLVPEARYRPCIFELVYLARPDSKLDDISVYKARLRMGDRLALKMKREGLADDIDVVIPIPDSGRTAAIEVAHHLDVKYREGFIKNRYIGRTFIMPGQAERRNSVRKKLNPIDLEFKGKHVCLVDDSIVRGTTCKQIIQMARDAGARKVTFATAAPAIRYPNVYGIDMPAADELVAHNRTEKQIADVIGADQLIYQDLPDLIAACQEGNPHITDFETSVFDGRYVTGDIDDAYFARLRQQRNDAAKQKANATQSPADALSPQPGITDLS
ncbi:MAG: amidophosphoribosyltransferase [Planctomycetota bacterium]